MTGSNQYDVIIIGGSYAGLSAAMALGRSLRRVLVIDSGLPCNRQTPHSHNFITHDGDTPHAIATLARQQVARYDTVQFYNGTATTGTKNDKDFEITTAEGTVLQARKLVMAAGIKDLMPDIEGFAQCWGITAIHCPYCHGYEVRGRETGILDNGDTVMHFAPMVRNLTTQLSIYTNGPATFTAEQKSILAERDIPVVEKQVTAVVHRDGYMQQIVFADGSSAAIDALYARLPFVQHSNIAQSLGCTLTEMGHLEVNNFQQTTVPGVYACGDSTTMMRSVASAVATGNLAGAMVNRELCEEEF